MNFEKREYQERALDLIRHNWKAGRKRLLLHLATGAGKTHIFSTVLINSKVPCLMIVRGRQLVDNASRRLLSEGVSHGVRMAGHRLNRPAERIQIASVDTLRSRNARPRVFDAESDLRLP